MLNSKKIDSLIEISKEAGNSIMDIYKTNFDYEMKEDDSPLTLADKTSNEIICQSLKKLTPDIPILSEENSDIPYNERIKWRKYWLVDPLDGTKEFIKKNDEFTTNIALICKNRPVFGIIHIPAKNETFWGQEDKGSYSLAGDNKNEIKKTKVTENKDGPLRIVTSKSHPSIQLKELLRKLDNYELINVGSSIKFCLVASGKADCYPRLGPTCEWDIAAGDAILKFAGGSILNLDGTDVDYNKKSLLNSHFIAAGKRSISLELF